MKPTKRNTGLSPLQWGGLLLAAVLVLLMFWGLRDRDIYDHETHEVRYAEGYDPAGENPDFAGQLFAECLESKAVPAGDYTLTVNYTAAGPGGRFELFDRDSQRVVAGGGYDPDAGRAEVSFRLDSRARSLSLQSWLGEGTVSLQSCRLQSSGPVYTDTWWTAVLLVLFGLLAWACLRQYRKGNRYPLMLLALAVVFCLPFVTDHLPHGHDIEFHLTRIDGLGASLNGGQFPVRSNADFMYGGGYIVSMMYPEAFLYLPGAMCALGASALFAYKVLCILIQLATVFVAWAAMRQLLGDKGGFWFSLFYFLNPYRMNNLFTRAAIGEALAMVFLPLAAVGLWQLFQGDRRRGFFCAVLGITGIVQSHIISILLLIIFGGAYGLGCLIFDRKRFFAGPGRLLTVLGAAVTTLLVNLWFIVPFLYYSGWDLKIYHDKPSLSKTAGYLWQMFMDSYSTGGDSFSPVTQGEMPISVGFAALLGIVLFLLVVLSPEKAKLQPLHRAAAVTALVIGLVAVFMASNLFPWEQLQSIAWLDSLLANIQFPWRLLGVAATMFSLVLAVDCLYLTENRHTAALAVLLVFLLSGASTIGAALLQEADTTLVNKSGGWDHNQISGGQYIRAEDNGIDVCNRIRAGYVLSRGTAQVTDFRRENLTMDVSFENPAGGQSVLELPLYYYGLHKARLENGPALPVTAGENNMVCVTVPEGTTEGTVQVRFAERRLFRVAELVSAVSLLGLAGLAVRGRGEKKKPLAE